MTRARITIIPHIILNSVNSLFGSTLLRSVLLFIGLLLILLQVALKLSFQEVDIVTLTDSFAALFFGLYFLCAGRHLSPSLFSAMLSVAVITWFLDNGILPLSFLLLNVFIFLGQLPWERKQLQPLPGEVYFLFFTLLAFCLFTYQLIALLSDSRFADTLLRLSNLQKLILAQALAQLVHLAFVSWLWFRFAHTLLPKALDVSLFLRTTTAVFFIFFCFFLAYGVSSLAEAGADSVFFIHYNLSLPLFSSLVLIASVLITKLRQFARLDFLFASASLIFIILIIWLMPSRTLVFSLALPTHQNLRWFLHTLNTHPLIGWGSFWRGAQLQFFSNFHLESLPKEVLSGDYFSIFYNGGLFLLVGFLSVVSVICWRLFRSSVSLLAGFVFLCLLVASVFLPLLFHPLPFLFALVFSVLLPRGVE